MTSLVPPPAVDTDDGQAVVLTHRDDIRSAMREDFGAHPDLFTDLVEVLDVAGRAAFADDVLQHTTSGGACVNVCAVQGALPSLGSGGVGQSGSGRHHRVEGFREFSDPRGVVVRGTGDLADAFLPPDGPVAQAVVDSVSNGPGAAAAAAPDSA